MLRMQQVSGYACICMDAWALSMQSELRQFRCKPLYEMMLHTIPSCAISSHLQPEDDFL